MRTAPRSQTDAGPDGAPTAALGRIGAVNLLAVLAITCGALPPFLIGSVAVQLRADLGLAISQVGILTAIFFGCAALSSPPAGRAVEKLGATLGMRIACAISAASLVGIALAPSVVVIGAVLIAGGLAYGLVHPSANLFIAERMVSTRQGLAYGIKQAGIPAATLAGGIAVPTLALTVGWRWAFVAAAGLAIVVAAAVPERRAGATGKRNSPPGRPELSVITLVTLTAGTALGAAAATSLGAYLVDSSVSAGLTAKAAGTLLAVASVIGIAARVGVGWAADRVTRGRLLWVAVMLLGGALGYLGLATGEPALVVPGTFLAFSGGWGWPGLFNFVVVLKNPSAPAAATGITQTGAYVGGIAGPLLFGFTAERTSYSTAWLLATALALLGAAMIARGRRMAQKTSWVDDQTKQQAAAITPAIPDRTENL